MITRERMLLLARWLDFGKRIRVEELAGPQPPSPVYDVEVPEVPRNSTCRLARLESGDLELFSHRRRDLCRALGRGGSSPQKPYGDLILLNGGRPQLVRPGVADHLGDGIIPGRALRRMDCRSRRCYGGSDWQDVFDQAIVTTMGSKRLDLTRADVLLRADGGTGLPPIPTSKFVIDSNLSHRLTLIDFDDRHDGQLRRWSSQRMAAYGTAGWSTLRGSTP